MEPDLKLILSQFNIQGSVASISPYGSGHINDTYKVLNSDRTKPDYLLQRINHHVFHDVSGMMDNIQSVTAFLYDKYDQEGIADARRRVLTLIETNDGQLFTNIQDRYWRLYLLLEEYRSWDLPETKEQIYEGAGAFGKFVADLNPFDATTLNVTIPYFHHLPQRIDTFETVVKGIDKVSGEEQVAIDFIQEQAHTMCLLQRMLDAGNLPLRVTHNDTKFNNVLFDDNNKAKCVIDLDTVMPGLIHFDFGDGARTGANTALEDEPDLNKVEIDIEAFDAYTNGFLDATRSILLKEEGELLVDGAMMMAFIMGVRFLTDHLDGNKYYKTAYPKHNFDRARCQLELSRKMLLRKADLVSIVNKYL